MSEIYRFMICRRCGDKWFMEDDYVHTYPDTGHCENCGTNGREIEFITVQRIWVLGSKSLEDLK